MISSAPTFLSTVPIRSLPALATTHFTPHSLDTMVQMMLASRLIPIDTIAQSILDIPRALIAVGSVRSASIAEVALAEYCSMMSSSLSTTITSAPLSRSLSAIACPNLPSPNTTNELYFMMNTSLYLLYIFCSFFIY